MYNVWEQEHLNTIVICYVQGLDKNGPTRMWTFLTTCESVRRGLAPDLCRGWLTGSCSLDLSLMPLFQKCTSFSHWQVSWKLVPPQSPCEASFLQRSPVRWLLRLPTAVWLLEAWQPHHLSSPAMSKEQLIVTDGRSVWIWWGCSMHWLLHKS